MDEEPNPVPRDGISAMVVISTPEVTRSFSWLHGLIRVQFLKLSTNSILSKILEPYHQIDIYSYMDVTI